MKIKYADIARHLGVSKAAVSLAVNDKPGISNETRKRILDYIQDLENHTAPSKKILLVYFKVNSKHILNMNYPIYTDVFSVFSAEAAARGYAFSTVYVEDSAEYALLECMREDVAAVILFATSMKDKLYEQFTNLNKPVILYDQEAPDSAHSSVCIDSYTALRQAIRVLDPSENETVKYIQSDAPIYNTETRRKAFVVAMLDRGFYVGKDDFITVDFMPEPAALQLEQYFRSHPLPNCIVAENYTTAIGLLMAMRSMQVSIPERVRIVSIDELPEYVPGKERIWQIRVPHSERATITMDLLEYEMQHRDQIKVRILGIPTVLEPEYLSKKRS